MAVENVGGIKGTAELDTTKFDASLSKISQTLDKTDPAMKRTEQNLNKIEKASKDAGDAAQKSSEMFGGLFKQFTAASIVGNFVTTAFTRITGTIRDFIKGSIEASSRLTELDSKARVVFGDTFPKVQKQVNAIAQEVGRASSSVLQFAADIGAILDAVGVSKKDLGDMSTTIAKLAIDLASFVNSSDEEAFQALQSGLVGMVQPLRRYGVVLTEANLQEYAHSKAIKQKVESMNEAQKVILRYNFILDHTKTAQGDAARTAESYANESRRLSGEITTLQEEMGKAATPVLADAMGNLAKALQDVRLFVKLLVEDIGTLYNVLSAKLGIGALTNLKQNITNGVTDKISKGLGLDTSIGRAAVGVFKAVGPKVSMNPLQGRLDEARNADNANQEKKLQESLNAQIARYGTSTKDAKKAADELKKTKDEIAKIEKDILDSINTQAKSNQDRLKSEKEDLELRKKLGIITDTEEKTLASINRRISFKKELVDDATKAWEEQTKALETVEKKIIEINKRISEEKQKLADNISDIQRDADRTKVDKAADVIRQINEIRSKANPSGLSSDESFKIGELQSKLKGFDTTTIDQAKGVATLNDSQLIDRETQQKIDDAKLESERRLKPLQDELAQAQTNKNQIISLEEAKKNAVVSALNDRVTQTIAAYKLEDDATTAHVNTQIAEFNRLSASLRTPAPVTAPKKFAGGGNVYGPGTGTSDSILAMLSNGERVITAEKNRLYSPILEAIHHGTLPVPRFAAGGNVTHDNSRSAHVEQHFHHSAQSSPAAMSWYVKRSLL